MGSLTYVFGIQRSGSTWLGKSLAAGMNRRYVHEPFNFELHPERKKYWLRYLPSTAEEEAFLHVVRAAAKPQGLSQRIFRRKALINDVHVWTAAPYIYNALRPRVVICVRHPCAVAASWARLEYSCRSLNRLLSERVLVDRYLADFTPHMQSSDDYFFRVGAFWGAAYHTMWQMSSQHAEWLWVTHERLCESPHEQFERLAAQLGSEFARGGHRFLDDQNHRETGGREAYSTVRPTAKQSDKWRAQLSADEQRTVLEEAAPFGVFDKWYSPPA